MFLWINSTFADHVDVALTATTKTAPPWTSIPGRDVLAAVMQMLKSKKKTLTDLTGVAVVPGPGPFSRVRAGVVVANTLAFSLGIGLYRIQKKRIARARVPLLPRYGAPPHITKPKKA